MADNRINRSGDGRDIDPSLGALSGEAAQQRVKQLDPHPDRRDHAWQQPASARKTGDPSYYDRPLLKEPVWIWAVPAYFYVGGLAGATAVLGAAAQLVDKERLWDLIVRCRWLAAIHGFLGALLLIHDLGRPERFLNMLRVFRIRSPMSIGSWVLAAAGGFTASAALLAHARGPLRKLGDLLAYPAALAGLPLAGYTAVLIANTAVPLWQAARNHLPFLFIGSALSSGGAILKWFSLSAREERIVDTVSLVGLATELVMDRLMEREVTQVAPVGQPLQQGLGGTLYKTAKICATAALLLGLLPGRARPKRMLEGTLGLLAALCLRFGIFYAGKASARNPQASFHQQRQGRGAAEVTGRSAVAGAVDEGAAA